MTIEVPRTRAGRRRLAAEHFAWVEAHEAGRAAHLAAQLEPGETVIAQQGLELRTHQVSTITDRRILFAWQPITPSDAEWRHDAVAFDEVTRWSIGRRHDGRPMLLLEHPPHLRPVIVPAHRFLWFKWGNAEIEKPHTDTTFLFGKSRNPVFAWIRGELWGREIPEGEPFVDAPAGTRAERTAGSSAVFLTLSETNRWSRRRGRVRGPGRRWHHRS
jgi:hypothetical protein